jgi:Putative peptidoglycan binding domain
LVFTKLFWFLQSEEQFMEAFAYLHLAQDYEDPEPKELTESVERWIEGLAMPHNLRPTTIALFTLPLLSLFCAEPWIGKASAQVSYEDNPNAVYLGTVGYPSGFATIRPNGDRVAQTNGCTVIPNPCSGYRPIYPSRPVYPVDPIPSVDSGYLPIRPAASASTFLRRGDTGEGVRYVQDLLRSAGYFNATSTGFYATLTESSVKAFQRDQGLSVDGIVGTQTLAALEAQG